jgi:carbamoyltransferase
MIVLGMNGGHDGSACLVKDGTLLGFIATERITRKKKDRGIRQEQIEYLLEKASLEWDDIDYVAITNWFFDAVGDRQLWDHEGVALRHANGQAYQPQQFLEFYQTGQPALEEVLEVSLYEHTFPAFIVDHHFAHCAAAFLTSPFKEAVSISLDYADGFAKNHMVCLFREDGSHQILKSGTELDIGSVYGQITDYLGFGPSLTGAGTLMALAAMGKPCALEDVWQWPMARDRFLFNTYEALLHRFRLPIPKRRVLYPQLAEEGGEADPAWLKGDDWKKGPHKHLAASVQKLLEETVTTLVREVVGQSNRTQVCLSGGSFLNVVANRMIRFDCGINPEDLYLFPACGDDGLSLGAALFLCRKLEPERTWDRWTDPQRIEGGKVYDKTALVAAIDKHKKAQIIKNEGELGDVVAALAAGKTVAWFEGGSEIGPRALGHRSILADPRTKKMKDHLNGKIKKRESFRPYAPLVLEEKAGEWFEDSQPSPFMLFNNRVLKDKADQIPAVLHTDGTARYQTVSEKNGLLHGLLQAFEEETGVPILVNTSFNVKGQPIVESPDDAVQTFIDTDLDFLWLDGIWVGKEEKK